MAWRDGRGTPKRALALAWRVAGSIDVELFASMVRGSPSLKIKLSVLTRMGVLLRAGEPWPTRASNACEGSRQSLGARQGRIGCCIKCCAIAVF